MFPKDDLRCLWKMGVKKYEKPKGERMNFGFPIGGNP